MVALLLFLVIGLVFVTVLALLVVGIVVGTKRAAERRQGLAAFAHSREWEYRPSDPALVDRFQGAPFGRGHGRHVSNVLIGQYDGRPFTAFDYQFTTGSGDDSSRHTYSVVALNLGVRAPDLAVGPTTTLRRWADSLTGRDIEIGDPAFDAAFTIHSPAPEFAADVLLSDVRDVMRHHPGLSWRITGDSLLMIRSGAHAPAEIDGKLQVMDALLDRIPDLVWERLRGEAPR
ncbi:hypothetical protein GUY44_06115 [Pimelobacter simplex]|uniref:Uncharacterized protein n=1 Tax=Nocardioides simplex TaxID=2045 RepID=A0A0A1DJN9_NOCSI|nr:hypothetical protein [Pimelobacter simplex]AIY17621.1 hypothetical protein KR76_14225 [Pimelobacter simplex]MCG8150048.1 hypothetical protein [Pimelobacter simplex]GEB13744.1 hypothetical protein NSI01_20590 [Pimelobacter simplex]SFM69116.1 hypothetical protein SAMN05421671_2927 [Pimelobacter simplex]